MMVRVKRRGWEDRDTVQKDTDFDTKRDEINPRLT